MGNNPVSGFNKIGATGGDIVGESESPFIYLDSSNYYLGRWYINTKDDIFSVSLKKKGESEYININSENLYTGLRVLPLEQDMTAGDKVYFNKHLSFTFTADVPKGSTIAIGNLKGITTDNESKIDGLVGSTYRENLITAFNDRVLLDGPRYLEKSAYVGARLTVPVGELGSGQDNYWAGYIDERDNLSTPLPYHDGAYINPLIHGFAAANQGSIIPVNASPDNNVINVQWFRRTMLDTDPRSGFGVIYWPTITVKYTIKYPENARKIVLASNDGSGPLSSLEAKGLIYYQNDKSKVGYNPNEEHALMIGQICITDDLNIYYNSNDLV